MENKINIACFKEGYRTAEVKDIWQWDYGQILRIQGLILPTAVEIHFSLDEHGGEAARRIGVTKDGVTDVPIPDSMVENESAYGDGYYFFAYIYLTDETSGNTEYKIRVKVSTRSKPEGYVSGGNDTFAEILKTVNEIAEDKVDIPVPAKVGQVLAVKETDESGKPTEFEAKDMSGGVSDEKIAEAVGTYMESHPIEESDPTVPDWAKQPEKPSYTASEVGADAAGTAESKVSAHNVSDTAHNDIRLLVQGLTARLNALADSDDTTLDQMSEVAAYIKSNKSLIDAITTSKVSVSDIIDNLTTNMSNKPLSAAQGVALKKLIDEITTVELDETLTDNTKAAPAGMVGELNGDLSNKLPKSPTNWDQWTAEEQAAARERIGIGEYELIEKIVVGYSITTSEPSDWKTSYTDYFTNTGTDIEPVYSPVTTEIPPVWEAGVYYLYDPNGAIINRNTLADGSPLNLSALIIDISIPKVDEVKKEMYFYGFGAAKNEKVFDLYVGNYGNLYRDSGKLLESIHVNGVWRNTIKNKIDSNSVVYSSIYYSKNKTIKSFRSHTAIISGVTVSIYGIKR